MDLVSDENSMIDDVIVQEIRMKAEKDKVPIIQEEGLQYLLQYIQTHSILNILEIGTAVGYSAIMMCRVSPKIKVTTIERDESRYLEAFQNVKRLHLEERITLIYRDALDVTLQEEYDLIFIDAAKAQNQKFFEHFEKYLRPYGTIITDNMKFHGLVDEDEKKIVSRNLRGLVRKIKAYTLFLENHPHYHTTFLSLGDGLAVSERQE